MTEDEEIKLIYSRTSVILMSLASLGEPLPLDQFTATALVVAAALMVKTGAKAPATREQWLATCASVFDAAAHLAIPEELKS